MTIRLMVFIGFSFFIATCVQKEAETAENDKPNIVLIMADDMGYSDLGVTGSEIQTPNLDKLANNGVLFTNCYNTSKCCPSRASLMTGLYQHQAGYGYMDDDLGYPSYQGRFREGVVTIPQILQQADYRNIMLGKWHLGYEKENAPLGRGFDRMYGIPKGGGVYFYPCIGRDRQVYLNEELLTPDSSWYSTDAFTDYAIQFAQEANTDKKPFFMYLAYIAPHFPLQARKEDIDKYRGKYSKGYEFYRDQRFAKQKELGIISVDTKMSPPDFNNWEEVVDKEQEDLKMTVYTAQVDRMDRNIGRLTASLKDMRILDNTIIIFLSDNGAGSVGFNDTPDAELGTRNSWAAYGHSWGNVSNTPYRYYKEYEHEGGIITPLIVHWPDGIEKKGGKIHEPIHITDIMPTILELSGTTYPETYNKEKVIPIAGKSFLPLLNGANQDPNKEMYWEHIGNKAVRIGDWKLVKRHKNPWELYDIKSDPTELNNLAQLKVELADSLENKWNAWAQKVGVRDWPVK